MRWVRVNFLTKTNTIEQLAAIFALVLVCASDEVRMAPGRVGMEDARRQAQGAIQHGCRSRCGDRYWQRKVRPWEVEVVQQCER